MNYLIISDIHGSTDNLKKALDTPLDYDGIILLGDYLYHGPRNPILDDYNPAAVVDILNTLSDPIAVRGNCDSEVDQMVLNFNMFKDYKDMTLDGKSIFITHGHIYTPDKDAQKLDYDIFLSGHTHLPYITKHNFGITMNPGSISLPKEGHPPTYGYITPQGLFIYTSDHELYRDYQY
ncbi:MAG TPA: phosphodiesterase [Erysipelothrix sp.]|nr:phosphodiesterase [Erysipelothrix sp.]